MWSQISLYIKRPFQRTGCYFWLWTLVWTSHLHVKYMCRWCVWGSIWCSSSISNPAGPLVVILRELFFYPPFPHEHSPWKICVPNGKDSFLLSSCNISMQIWWSFMMRHQSIAVQMKEIMPLVALTWLLVYFKVLMFYSSFIQMNLLWTASDLHALCTRVQLL